MSDRLVSYISPALLILRITNESTRCMPPNAAEEFLAIFLHVRGRLIAATAEINEQKEREKEREK